MWNLCQRLGSKSLYIFNEHFLTALHKFVITHVFTTNEWASSSSTPGINRHYYTLTIFCPLIWVVFVQCWLEVRLYSLDALTLLVLRTGLQLADKKSGQAEKLSNFPGGRYDLSLQSVLLTMTPQAEWEIRCHWFPVLWQILSFSLHLGNILRLINCLCSYSKKNWLS